MAKQKRRLSLVAKFAFVIVTIAAIAFSATWLVSGSGAKANAATVACDTESQENCNQPECQLNSDRICPLDNTDDKVPDEQEVPQDPVPNPTPQVLGASTTDPTFTGK